MSAAVTMQQPGWTPKHGGEPLPTNIDQSVSFPPSDVKLLVCDATTGAPIGTKFSESFLHSTYCSCVHLYRFNYLPTDISIWTKYSRRKVQDFPMCSLPRLPYLRRLAHRLFSMTLMWPFELKTRPTPMKKVYPLLVHFVVSI